MEDTSIINELQKLDVLIAKKMFKISKIENTNHPPSPLQFKILAYLLENKNNNISQSDLEKKLNVSRATISGVLFTMEKNEIISRIPSTTDARSKLIKLTDKSIERFTEMKNIWKKMSDELVKGISDKDLNTFRKVLDSMKQNLYKLDD